MPRWLSIGAKVFGGVFVVLVATLVAGIAVLKNTDFNRYKTDIQRIVQETTGRELVIAGDFDLAVSLSPTLTVSDITFAGAEWGNGAPMVRLNRLDAKVSLQALVDGVLDVDYIVLDGVELVFETDAKGHANWEFDLPGVDEEGREGSPDDALIIAPHVRDVRLRDVHVVYLDGATGARLETDLDSADFAATDLNSPLKGALVARYNGVRLDADVELGSLAQLIGSEGAPFPVNVKVGGDGLRADVIGTVDQPNRGMTVDVRLNAEVENTAVVAKLLGVDMPIVSDVKLLANVNGAGTAYRFEGLDLKIGESDLTGAVAVDLSGQRLGVTGELESRVLDLNALLDLSPANTSDAKPDRVFPKDPLPLDILETLNANVRFAGQRVAFDALDFRDVKAGVKLKDGRLELSPLRVRLDGGRMSARLKLDGRADPPSLNLRAALRDVDVGMLAALAGKGGLVSLKMDGEIDLQGRGETVHHLMSGLNGSTNLIGRNGKIEDEKLSDLGEGFAWASNKDANQIACVVAKMPIENGVATAQTVVLDTSGITAQVTGNIDLGGELFHLTVHTDAKTPSLASFAVPVRIKGPLIEPRLDVDPGEAVIGTVGNVVKAPAELLGGLLLGTLDLLDGNSEKKPSLKDDPCLKALGGGKTGAESKADPLPSSPADDPEQAQKPDSGTSSGDPLKDLEKVGEALKNLF